MYSPKTDICGSNSLQRWAHKSSVIHKWMLWCRLQRNRDSDLCTDRLTCVHSLKWTYSPETYLCGLWQATTCRNELTASPSYVLWTSCTAQWRSSADCVKEQLAEMSRQLNHTERWSSRYMIDCWIRQSLKFWELDMCSQPHHDIDPRIRLTCYDSHRQQLKGTWRTAQEIISQSIWHIHISEAHIDCIRGERQEDWGLGFRNPNTHHMIPHNTHTPSS